MQNNKVKKVTLNSYLLSVLVLPGAGHLAIDKKITGYLIMGVSLFFVAFFLSAIFSISSDAANKIVAGELIFSQIQTYIHEQIQLVVKGRLAICWWGFWVVWLLALIDLARLQYLSRSGHTL